MNGFNIPINNFGDSVLTVVTITSFLVATKLVYPRKTPNHHDWNNFQIQIKLVSYKGHISLNKLIDAQLPSVALRYALGKNGGQYALWLKATQLQPLVRLMAFAKRVFGHGSLKENDQEVLVAEEPLQSVLPLRFSFHTKGPMETYHQ